MTALPWLPTAPADPTLAALERFLAMAEAQPQTVQPPFPQYVNDPVGFFRDVLGVEPWGRMPGMPPEHGTQIDILEAIRDNDRVAVRSGHKISKSLSAAGIALWWVNTRTDAKVTLTAPAAHQLRSILWPEIRLLHQGEHPGRRPGAPRRKLPGLLHLDPGAGLVIRDGWGIWGLTTNEPERMSGQSGAKQLVVVDEASGYPEEIFTSVFGNMAGGGKVLLISNPTRTTGTFFDVFHDKGAGWRRLWTSSTSTPNFYTRRGAPGWIDGLATPEWDTEMQAKWGGPGAPLYDVRVLGKFPSQADNAVIGIDLVDLAVSRWEAEQEGEEPERDSLELGVDVARDGDDESIVCARRGYRVVALEAVTLDRSPGAIPLGHQVGEAAARVARALARPTDRYIPRVKVDVIGVGASVVDYLLAQYSEDFEIVGVNVGAGADADVVVVPSTDGKPALTARDVYRNLRAQVWFVVRDWLKAGGRIPPDERLRGELVAPTFRYIERGRIAVQEKSDLKKTLKRSPDRADALGLAVYEPPVSDQASVGVELIG